MKQMRKSQQLQQQPQPQEFLVICNYLPSEETRRIFAANNSNNTTNNYANVDLLPLWIGDLVRVVASQGHWCFGYRLQESEKRGLFPRANVIQHELPPTKTERKNEPNESEAEQLAVEIGEAVKVCQELDRNFLIKIPKNSI
jgi:hypothetical protein